MDSYNKENYFKKNEDKSLEKLQSRALFNDPAYLFVFKKTEKIVAAIYLITNLISDTEPVKIQIRNCALQIISGTVSLKQTSGTGSKQGVYKIMSFISEIISLIKVATISENISVMNSNVIQHELYLLLSNLETLNLETINGAMLLPRDFFNIPEPIIQNSNANYNVSENVKTTAVSSKGQYKTPALLKDKKAQIESANNSKDSRKEKMVKLLKDGKILGIKDFVKEIKDCSEKTIQRELLTLVETGVLKKTGERRWSLYSLV